MRQGSQGGSRPISEMNTVKSRKVGLPVGSRASRGNTDLMFQRRALATCGKRLLVFANCLMVVYDHI